VPLQDLRYLRIGHWDFDGVDRLGEMVVHEDAVAAVEAAFRRLHEIRFPIRSMRLVDDFGADDDASMAADNTSAFNCRPVAGTSTWSQHSYGRAVDVNPLENPYVTGNGTFPPSGAAFAVRSGAQGQFMAGGDEVRASPTAAGAGAVTGPAPRTTSTSPLRVAERSLEQAPGRDGARPLGGRAPVRSGVAEDQKGVGGWVPPPWVPPPALGSWPPSSWNFRNAPPARPRAARVARKIPILRSRSMVKPGTPTS
jgi:hypothetical protein